MPGWGFAHTDFCKCFLPGSATLGGIDYKVLRGLPRRTSLRESDVLTAEGSNQTRPALRANGIARRFVWPRSHRIVGRLDSSQSNSSNFAPETSLPMVWLSTGGLKSATGATFCLSSSPVANEMLRLGSSITFLLQLMHIVVVSSSPIRLTESRNRRSFRSFGRRYDVRFSRPSD